MRYALLVVLGVLLTAAGVVWALQGFSVIGGSFMSGNSTYQIVGPVVALVGLVLAGLGLRGRRSASP
jgi:hypothetical protein